MNSGPSTAVPWQHSPELRRPRPPRHGGAWSLAQRLLILAFLGLVAWLLTRQLQNLDWDALGAALRGYGPFTVLLAALFAGISYLLHAAFDLFGWWSTDRRVTVRQMLSSAFVSYAYNQNLGSIIGGFGLRLRLYSRLGLKKSQIMRIIVLALLANWPAYLILAGGALVLGQLPAPPGDWPLHEDAARTLGALLIAAALAYFAACTLLAGRCWTLRGYHLELPSQKMALLQLALALPSWMAMAAVLHVFLPEPISFGAATAVLMAASMAAVLTHIPAGLGVLEAVVLGFFGERFGNEPLLAALFAYRAIYYIAPLLLATIMYVVLELRLRRPAAARSARSTL